MRDDISELILKLGKYPSVYNGKIKRVIDKNNKIFQSNYVPYTISMCNNSLFTIDTTKNITPMEYNGHVYCVTVPSHVIYVRRNGHSCWCGNSGTTIVACIKEKRRSIGYEIDPDMFLVGEKTNRAVRIRWG